MSSAVARVDTRVVSIPLVRTFVTAQRASSVHEAVLVRAHDSDGRVGWGEAPCSWRVTGESQASVEAAVNGPLAAVVLGRDAGDPGTLGDDIAAGLAFNFAAKSAIECAVYDLAAQQAGVPLAVYLGGGPLAARTDMTLSAGDPESVLEAALSAVEAGFGTLKVKCGAGHDDRATLGLLRDAVGRDVVLRVDANQGWDQREAVEIIRGWENDGLDIELVEQPVAARALDALAFVTSRVETPILADEAVWNNYDLSDIVRLRAADMVNIKLAKAGGIRESVRMAHRATEHGLGFVIGSMMESQVGIAAAASLAAALDPAGRLVHDLDAGTWLRSSPVVGGARYDGPVIALSDSSGLGISHWAGGEA